MSTDTREDASFPVELDRLLFVVGAHVLPSFDTGQWLGIIPTVPWHRFRRVWCLLDHLSVIPYRNERTYASGLHFVREAIHDVFCEVERCLKHLSRFPFYVPRRQNLAIFVPLVVLGLHMLGRVVSIQTEEDIVFLIIFTLEGIRAAGAAVGYVVVGGILLHGFC